MIRDPLQSNETGGRVIRSGPRKPELRVMRGGKSVIGNTAPYRSPVPDLGRYEGREGPDEYGHRMMVNAAAFAFTSLLVMAGVWLAMMMVHA